MNATIEKPKEPDKTKKTRRCAGRIMTKLEMEFYRDSCGYERDREGRIKKTSEQ